MKKVEETKIIVSKLNIIDEINDDSLCSIDLQNLKKKKNTFFMKRIIDILGSIVGIIISAVIIFFVAVTMKITEPKGPIFFSQDRIGKNGKTFRMYKIRSMCIDAEEKLEELMKHNEVEGAMFKMKNDPRITRIGKFIRKTSIDELPQLWNVLRGDMSLVGPRPPLIREVEEYTIHDRQRLLVKPGCTGLWQVSGRNELDFDEMVDLDIQYIENIGIINDFKIIIKTLFIMIKPNGAY